MKPRLLLLLLLGPALPAQGWGALQGATTRPSGRYPGQLGPLPGAKNLGRLPIGGGLPIPPGTGLGGAFPLLPLPTRAAALPGRGQDRSLSRWPSWVRIGGPGKRVPTSSELGTGRDPGDLFLTRIQERVEVMPAEEEAFFPLFFWDKSRVLRVGSKVRTLGGRALLLFPDGTSGEIARTTRMHFLAGNEDRLELRFTELGRIRFGLGTREVRLELPEGSLLVGSRTEVQIRKLRKRAPWSFRGVEERLMVRNWGPASVKLTLGRIGIELPPRRMCLLPMSFSRDGKPSIPPEEPRLDLGMGGGGVPLRSDMQTEIHRKDGGLTIRARSGTGRLQWGGVRIHLPEGKVLRLDPLGGNPFGEDRPLPKKEGS